MRKLIFLLGILVFIGCKNDEKTTLQQSTNTYPKMNLKSLHTEDKAVQTKLLLQAKEGKVMSLQIAKGKELKEHVSNVQAILICVSGKSIYKELSGETNLEAGDYVMIEKDVKHEVLALTNSNFILVK
jgi:quercetin dioxygenase-like cupin family protein